MGTLKEARLVKSLRSPEHVRLRQLLRAARRKAGLSQRQTAQQLGRPQSFVSKYECGERRLDVVEFIRIARVLRFSPAAAVRKIEAMHGRMPRMPRPRNPK